MQLGRSAWDLGICRICRSSSFPPTATWSSSCIRLNESRKGRAWALTRRPQCLSASSTKEVEHSGQWPTAVRSSPRHPCGLLVHLPGGFTEELRKVGFIRLKDNFPFRIWVSDSRIWWSQDAKHAQLLSSSTSQAHKDGFFAGRCASHCEGAFRVRAKRSNFCSFADSTGKSNRQSYPNKAHGLEILTPQATSRQSEMGGFEALCHNFVVILLRPHEPGQWESRRS